GETARTVLGSENSDAVGGGVAIGAGSTGVLTVATTGVPRDKSADGCAATAGTGTRASGGDILLSGAGAESIGCSSELRTLTWADCALSFERVAPTSPEVAMFSSLGGCTLIEASPMVGCGGRGAPSMSDKSSTTIAGGIITAPAIGNPPRESTSGAFGIRCRRCANRGHVWTVPTR